MNQKILKYVEKSLKNDKTLSLINWNEEKHMKSLSFGILMVLLIEKYICKLRYTGRHPLSYVSKPQ